MEGNTIDNRSSNKVNEDKNRLARIAELMVKLEYAIALYEKNPCRENKLIITKYTNLYKEEYYRLFQEYPDLSKYESLETNDEERV